ncbi:MAG: glycosyltransferase family 2 protein [Pseudohongiellaceae bacterium]
MIRACSIIIPNYNGARLLPRYLPAALLESQQYPAACEVIVVDDASTDNSVELLSTDFPQVRLLRHHANQGFSGAVHTGIGAARHELIFLLNSDVELIPGCLKILAGYFEDESTFAVNPLILNQDRELNQSSWTRSRFVRGHLKLIPLDVSALPQMRQDGSFPTLYCSGGSVMMRKQMFEELGGFSELYKPFYYEDFDLGLRAWYKGWFSHFIPAAEVIHADKGTIEDHYKSELIKRTQRRNRYKLEWSHFPLSRLMFSTLPFSLLQIFGELILFDKKNLLAFRDALKDLGAIREARHSIKVSAPTAKKLQDIIELTLQNKN